MFSSFIINLIVDGVCFSFGIFYIQFLEYFQESKGKTSVVGSVLNGMYLSMGPLVSALANKFGCRRVTIIGSIVSTIAFILSTFSPNINVLIVTFGALGGFGFGLMYLPSIVMVGYYFEKRRALATGVAVCGSGIGGFIFSPLCNALISNYGWKGATIIISGVVLNGLVCGALFRPLEVKMKKEKDNLKNNDSNGIHINGCSQSERNKYLNRSYQEICNVKSPECAKYCKSMDDLILKDSLINGDKTKMLYRKDRFYSGSLKSLNQNEDKFDLEAVKVQEDLEKSSGCSKYCSSFLASMKQTMDFSLLLNPVFKIYGISCFLCMFGFFIPFTYLIDYAVENGVSKSKGSFLISIIGIANTISRVLCGWISDQPWADSLLINNIALIIGGTATMMIPLCTTYWSMCLVSSIFGMCIAVFVSLRSIIMVDLIGLDKLTNAFGLVTMCQGISSFIGAPAAGKNKH
ncbi:DgyrCDS6491 [Dimorphilus gyrociliatus]|uniref:DgyrCDS6491 n=1 Tax=Dimorphilus gyrociliatus TaxID=2664684 RepID=A0A7I8VNW1_9ANNE|nr:DgyrCDS6491 [Dimorphilus gyrociliatus]